MPLQFHPILNSGTRFEFLFPCVGFHSFMTYETLKGISNRRGCCLCGKAAIEEEPETFDARP